MELRINMISKIISRGYVTIHIKNSNTTFMFFIFKKKIITISDISLSAGYSSWRVHDGVYFMCRGV